MDEPSPSPQKIGELFVIQYYTQMHKDPAQMHRFYADNSVLVRGGSEMGSEESVVGQKNIHEKILSLDLQCAHTKVRQMDSHTTISDGIVIQVTGELSISGNPMRPFVQTFVLALESERKYYIHNDIFRYQLYDEDYISEGDAIDQDSQEVEIVQSDLSSTAKEVQSPVVPEDTFYRGTEANLPVVASVSDRSGKSTPTPSGSIGQPEPPPVATSTDWNEQYEDNEVIQSNGLPEQAHLGGDEPTYPEDEVLEGEDGVGDTVEQSKQPGTWASRIAQNIPTSTRQQPPSYTQASKSSALTTQSRPGNNLSTLQEPKPQRKPQERRPDRPVAEKKPYTQSSTTRSYSDLVQIFVGGIMPTNTEEEIREVFKDYGNVVEVRFNQKNFGFVVFETEESVQNILAVRKEKTFSLKGRMLNIEEKRPSKSYGGGPVGGRKPFAPTQQGSGSGGFTNNRQAPRPMNRPPQRRN